MMASKFIYDEGVDDEVFNDEWAAAADLETEDINELERQFLSAIVSISLSTCFPCFTKHIVIKTDVITGTIS